MKVSCELQTYKGKGLSLENDSTMLVRDVDDEELVEFTIFTETGAIIKTFTINGKELISAINKCQLRFGR